MNTGYYSYGRSPERMKQRITITRNNFSKYKTSGKKHYKYASTKSGTC